jgi:hypothetical protein
MKQNTAALTNDSHLCSHRTRTGRRCRLPVLPNSALCFRHGSGLETQRPDADLASAFNQLGHFRSAVVINEFLSKLLTLLVQDRISTRRAAVLGYLTNQLLRTLPAIDHELNSDDDDEDTLIVIHTDRPCHEDSDLESSEPSGGLAKTDEAAHNAGASADAKSANYEQPAKSG